MMKRILFSSLLLSVFMTVSAQEEKKIILLHTNDLHSRLNGFAPESEYSPYMTGNDRTKGGFARIAAIIKKEKRENPGLTLAVDAGDFLMGTLFQSLEVKTGFQLGLMQKMGYDLVCLGNHEFDFGTVKLAEIINRAGENGTIPPILSGNAEFSSSDPGDDGLERLFSDGTISRKLVIKNFKYIPSLGCVVGVMYWQK